MLRLGKWHDQHWRSTSSSACPIQALGPDRALFTSFEIIREALHEFSNLSRLCMVKFKRIRHHNPVEMAPFPFGDGFEFPTQDVQPHVKHLQLVRDVIYHALYMCDLVYSHNLRLPRSCVQRLYLHIMVVIRLQSNCCTLFATKSARVQNETKTSWLGPCGLGVTPSAEDQHTKGAQHTVVGMWDEWRPHRSCCKIEYKIDYSHFGPKIGPTVSSQIQSFVSKAPRKENKLEYKNCLAWGWAALRFKSIGASRWCQKANVASLGKGAGDDECCCERLQHAKRSYQLSHVGGYMHLLIPNQ